MVRCDTVTTAGNVLTYGLAEMVGYMKVRIASERHGHVAVCTDVEC